MIKNTNLIISYIVYEISTTDKVKIYELLAKVLLACHCCVFKNHKII